MLASYLYKILLSQIQRGIFPFSIPLFYHNLFALASFPNFLKSFPFCPFARHSSTNCLPTVLSRMCWVFNSPTLCLRTAVINLDKNRSSSSRNFFRVRKFLNREKKKRYYKINEQLDLLDLNCSQRWHWINNSFDYFSTVQRVDEPTTKTSSNRYLRIIPVFIPVKNSCSNLRVVYIDAMASKHDRFSFEGKVFEGSVTGVE